MHIDTQDYEERASNKAKATPLPKLQVLIIMIVMLAEPISSTVIYPFVNQFVRDTGITDGDERKVGHYAGLLVSFLCFPARIWRVGRVTPISRSQPFSLRNAQLFSNGAGFLIKSAVDPYFFSVLSVSQFHCLRLGSRTVTGHCSLRDVRKELLMGTSVSRLRRAKKKSLHGLIFPNRRYENYDY
jgi:hypothetical protein